MPVVPVSRGQPDDASTSADQRSMRRHSGGEVSPKCRWVAPGPGDQGHPERSRGIASTVGTSFS
jgi:hypothetical protein